MEINVIVDIILSILSFILSLLSILFVILTIRQNNKLLYANSRPYISVYFAYEENNRELYICVKNSGNSSAIIKNLELSSDIVLHNKTMNDTLKGALLAPQQQVHFYVVNKKEIMKSGPYQYDIFIEYIDVNKPRKTINENYTIDISYILQVLNSVNNISSSSKTDDNLYNIERDIKAIALQKL